MFKKLITSKLFWFFLIIILAGGGFFYYKQSQPIIPEFSSTRVIKEDLTQTVNETGTVQSDVEVAYGWESSGQVINIYKKIGDTVKKGTVIADIDMQKEHYALLQAQSALQGAQAKLDQKVAGASKEEIAESLANISQKGAVLDQKETDLVKTQVSGDKAINAAESALKTAENNLQIDDVANDPLQEEFVVVRDAYTDLTDTLKSHITTLRDALQEADAILGIDDPRSNDEYENVLSLKNTSLLLEARLHYNRAKQRINEAEPEINQLSSLSTYETIDTQKDLSVIATQHTQTLLLVMVDVLNNTFAANNLSVAELDTLKTTIATTRTSVNTSATSLTTSIQAISTAENSANSLNIAYEKARQDLEDTKKEVVSLIEAAKTAIASQQSLMAQTEATHNTLIAPPRDVDLASLRADISLNRAKVSDTRNSLSKRTLVALTNGIVSALDIDIGEIVSINTPVVQIISSDISIDVDISESDIAKVALGDMVTMTLDAFGEDNIFTGTVTAIEPAETEISGVIYYKTTVTIDPKENGFPIKPGMTVNVSIETDKKDAVLTIPQRAISERDNKKFVKVVTNTALGAYKEVEIATGLRGDEGMIEIIAGLQENDEIITFLKEKE